MKDEFRHFPEGFGWVLLIYIILMAFIIMFIIHGPAVDPAEYAGYVI